MYPQSISKQGEYFLFCINHGGMQYKNEGKMYICFKLTTLYRKKPIPFPTIYIFRFGIGSVVITLFHIFNIFSLKLYICVFLQGQLSNLNGAKHSQASYAFFVLVKGDRQDTILSFTLVINGVSTASGGFQSFFGGCISAKI